MEHLVIHDVVDCAPRHPGMVEDTTHDDGIMGGIVVAEAVAGMVSAPGHQRTSEEPVKKAGIQGFKDHLQVVGSALSGVQTFTSAHLAHKVRFSADVVTGNVAT